MAGNSTVGRGIGDRPAQPVGQQIGRAHLVHELRVDDPAAALREAFGLDQHVVGEAGVAISATSAAARIAFLIISFSRAI